MLWRKSPFFHCDRRLLDMSITLFKIGIYESNFPFQMVKKQCKKFLKSHEIVGYKNRKGGNLKGGRNLLHTMLAQHYHDMGITMT